MRFHKAAPLALLSTSMIFAQAAGFVVLAQDHPDGRLNVRQSADRGTETDYSYRKNGRRPDLGERFHVDAPGVLVAYEVSGLSTFGAEVRESDRRDVDHGVWASPSDQGIEAVPADFAFAPLESSAAHLDEAARMPLSRRGASAPTLGGSHLAVEKPLISTPPGPDGGAVNPSLVMVTGGNAEP